MSQVFHCEKCGETGSVEVKEGSGAWSVVQDIASEHKRLSPSCDNPVERIRVLNATLSK